MFFDLFQKYIVLVSILGDTSNHIPLKYMCLIKISNRFRFVNLNLKAINTFRNFKIGSDVLRYEGLKLANVPLHPLLVGYKTHNKYEKISKFKLCS